MKKLVLFLLLTILLLGILSTSILKAQDEEITLQLTIGLSSYVLNGKQFQMDVSPEIVAGRTFVPIRVVAESFEATVEWNATLKEVTITQQEKIIKLRIGSKEASVDGKLYVLEAAPYIKSGRTMVPIRFISEAIGLTVSWDSKTKTVTIKGKVSSIVMPTTPVELLGAGATFPQPLYTKWFDIYYTTTNKLIKVNYQGIGSGGGIQQLIEKVVDFGASDAPMNSDEEKKAGAEVIHIPVALGAVVVTYNLPGNPKLKLTGEVIADIFMGKIIKWNHQRIKELNPDINLPDLNITVAYRSDGSGTTYVFSDYLSKVSETWKKELGTGKSLNWKVGLGGKGNAGVAGIVTQTPGAIGYVELIYAEQNGLPYAMIRNKSGNFINPDLKSISEAANVKIPQDTKVSIVDTDNPQGYPISSFTWILVYKEQKYGNRDLNKAKALVALLRWMNSEAQEYSESLLYARIPEEVRKVNLENIKRLTFDGKPIK